MNKPILLIALSLLITLPSRSAETNTNAMITEVYHVSAGAIHMVRNGEVFRDLGKDGATGPGDVKKIFEDSGVPFPDGSKIVYDERSSDIIMRNTPSNHEVFQRVLATFNVVPTQVEIEVKLIRVCDRQLAQRLTAITLTNLPPGKVEVLDRNSVLTISGSEARAAHWQTLDELTEKKEPPAPQTNNVTTAAIETTNGFGSELRATPTIGPDAYTINLTIVWECRRLNGWAQVPGAKGMVTVPDVTAKNLTTSLVLNDGQSAILTATDAIPSAAIAGHKGEESCSEFLVVTPRLLDPRGLPINRPRLKR